MHKIYALVSYLTSRVTTLPFEVIMWLWELSRVADLDFLNYGGFESQALPKCLACDSADSWTRQDFFDDIAFVFRSAVRGGLDVRCSVCGGCVREGDGSVVVIVGFQEAGGATTLCRGCFLDPDGRWRAANRLRAATRSGLVTDPEAAIMSIDCL